MKPRRCGKRYNTMPKGPHLDVLLEHRVAAADMGKYVHAADLAVQLGVKVQVIAAALNRLRIAPAFCKHGRRLVLRAMVPLIAAWLVNNPLLKGKPMTGTPQPYTPIRRLRDFIEDAQAQGITFVNFETAVQVACQQCPGLDENDRVKATAAALDQLVKEGVIVAHGNPLDSLTLLYTF